MSHQFKNIRFLKVGLRMVRKYVDLTPPFEVDVVFVMFCWLVCYWTLTSDLDFVVELEAHMYLTWFVDEYLCNFTLWLKLFFVMKALGFRFYYVQIETPRFEDLKGRARHIIEEFVKSSAVKFIGIVDRINISYDGVRYPVDFFLKHFYDRFYPAECAEAFSTYRRVNPSLKLKLEYLDKFGSPNMFTARESEIKCALWSIIADVRSSPNYRWLLSDISRSVGGRDFASLDIDWSSAAGYPYAQGVKRRDCFDSALADAVDLLAHDEHFHAYAKDHVWYTTGRAKMIEVGDADSGRLISYSGFAFMLIAMLLVQPWAKFMNSFHWCGVGWSWMHGGARKFAEYFKAQKGVAPSGFRFVSVDIKSWDSKVHPSLMATLPEFYQWLMEAADVDERYHHRFLIIVWDMIKAKILFPMGYLFQVFQGMKSGWCNTANDNTLIHEVVFRGIMARVGYIRHVLYGDDNFMLVPDHISDDQLVAEYLRFGMVVGRIHSSVLLSEVDFLAKYVHYVDGEYFTFRPSVETHARMLMPEELDPSFRNRPDPIIAAERCLGHLLDNPFNANVRKVCYDLLDKIRSFYHVEFVEITPEMRREHPWRQFADLPPKISTAPSLEFIEELYGVRPKPIKLEWPSLPKLHLLSARMLDSNCFPYDQAMKMIAHVTSALHKKSRKRVKSMVRCLSPFKVPISTYGTHAARLEFAIKHWKLKFRNALDFGSHPGACAHSLLKVCRDVTCVSLHPNKDSHRDFCPYVFRDEHVQVIEADADKYVPERQYDLIHDDVDLVGNKTGAQELDLSLRAILRAKRCSKYTGTYVLTLRYITPILFTALYETYKSYGYVDIIKPMFSSPWKSEFMIMFRKKKSGVYLRKSLFMQMFNSYLNRSAGSLIRWNEFIGSIIDEKEWPVHPLQNDEDYQKSLHQWLIRPNLVAVGSRASPKFRCNIDDG